MSDTWPSCFLRPLYIAPFLSSWSSHLSKPRVVGHTHILSQYWRELRKAVKHTTQFPGVRPRPSLATWKKLQAASSSPWRSSDWWTALVLPCAPLAHPPDTCLSPARMAALERAWGMLQMATSFISGTPHTCWTNEKLNVVPNRSLCGGSDCLRQILMPQKWRGKKKKKTELGRDLKAHFPEAKESWHSAPFNIKRTFHRTYERILGKAILSPPKGKDSRPHSVQVELILHKMNFIWLILVASNMSTYYLLVSRLLGSIT